MARVADVWDWLAHGSGDARTRPFPGARKPGSSRRAARTAGPGSQPGTGSLAARTDTQPERRIVKARRVIGTPVFDASGAKAGRIADLSIDKQTGQVVYALIGIEGGFGFLRRLYPAPWRLLRYDARQGGYVAPADRTDVEVGPALTPEELRGLGAGDDAWRDRLGAYYGAYLAVPFI